MKPISALLVAIIFSITVQAQTSAVSKAKSAMKSNDFSKAITEIDKASEHSKTKNDPNTWWVRAQVYMNADKNGSGGEFALAESLNSFRKAKELNNGDVSKFVAKDDDGYPVPYDQALQNYWAYYFNKGADAYGEENYKVAVAEFEKAQLIQPEDTNAYINAALAAHNDQEWKAAKRNYKGALDNGVRSKDIFSLYVSILNSQQSTRNQALEIIRKARSIYPTDNELARSEINVLIQLGRADEARASLLNQIEQEPGNAVLRFTLGVMLEELGDLKGAKNAYRGAIGADPNDYNSNFNLGVIMINEATDIIKERNNLGISQADKSRGDVLDAEIDKKLEQCLPQWETIHRLEPTDITALETLRYIYSQLKMDEKAIAIQDKIDALRG